MKKPMTMDEFAKQQNEAAVRQREALRTAILERIRAKNITLNDSAVATRVKERMRTSDEPRHEAELAVLAECLVAGASPEQKAFGNESFAKEVDRTMRDEGIGYMTASNRVAARRQRAKDAPAAPNAVTAPPVPLSQSSAPAADTFAHRLSQKIEADEEQAAVALDGARTFAGVRLSREARVNLVARRLIKMGVERGRAVKFAEAALDVVARGTR